MVEEEEIPLQDVSGSLESSGHLQERTAHAFWNELQEEHWLQEAVGQE